MKKLNQLLLALFVTTLIACEKENSNAVPNSPRLVNLSDTLSIKMSETVFSNDFSIQLDSLGDSRCPKNVNCFWEGLADAKIIVTKGSSSQTIHLKTAYKLDTATVFNKFLRIIDVSPYPNSVNQIPQRDYVVRLLVQ